MKLSKLKKYRKRYNILRDLGANNPSLLLGVDLPFVVATAFTLKNAVAISIQMLLIHFVTMMVARTVMIRLPFRIRALANVFVSTIMMLISREIVIVLFPGIVNSVGIYLYLMAVNGLTLLQATAKEGPRTLRQIAVRAIVDIGLFTLIMLAVALVREVLGNATIWGIPIPLPFRMSGMQIPFFGFVITGFLLAAVRSSNKKIAGLRLSGAAMRDAVYVELDEPVHASKAPQQEAGQQEEIPFWEENINQSKNTQSGRSLPALSGLEEDAASLEEDQ